MNSNWGKRLKEQREKLGIKAEALAESLGMTRQGYYRYEKGDAVSLNAKHLSVLIKRGFDVKYIFSADTESSGIYERLNMTEEICSLLRERVSTLEDSHARVRVLLREVQQKINIEPTSELQKTS